MQKKKKIQTGVGRRIIDRILRIIYLKCVERKKQFLIRNKEIKFNFYENKYIRIV